VTRHELKEIEQDQFVAKVGEAIEYTSSHKSLVVRWSAIGVAALLLIAGGWWFFSYQKAQRQADLREAYSTAEASVAKEASPFSKNFPTQQAKDEAVLKAYGAIASKYSGTREGDIGAYYAAVLRNDQGDTNGAISLLKSVIDGGRPMASLAKVSLASLYAGQGRYPEAEALAKGLIESPTSLVSKEHAQILLAQILAKHDPAAAKKLLLTIKIPPGALERPALERATDMLRTSIDLPQ
jgi:hypothetical protein